MLERNADNHYQYSRRVIKSKKVIETNQTGIGIIIIKNICDHYHFFMHVKRVEISSYNMQNSTTKRPFPSERSSDLNESQRLLPSKGKKKKKCCKITFIAVI